MGRAVHVIGNGDGANLYKPSKGIKLTCNLPPFPVEDVYATCMVDFKMMGAIAEGSLQVPGEWICGARPQLWCQKKPEFYMKYAPQIKEFYMALPEYAKDYTDWNCGHFAVHYALNKLKADEVHMYGFDSVFDFNMKSCTDFYLSSDRADPNSFRLMNNWRPIWEAMFNEFADRKIILHHRHDGLRLTVGSNVEIRVSNGK